ncbi:hypothetical protein RFI_25843, partial [Reticulomyxa filosa]
TDFTLYEEKKIRTQKSTLKRQLCEIRIDSCHHVGVDGKKNTQNRKEQEDDKEKIKSFTPKKKTENINSKTRDTNDNDNDGRNVICCLLYDKIINFWISKVNTNFINLIDTGNVVEIEFSIFNDDC